MSPDIRIAINTIVQYIRTLINIILGFYSTRIVLNALGDNDYGIYMLIAGIVGMLSFFTNALSITTQRFLSFHKGRNDLSKQTLVFSNSLFIHIGVCIIIWLTLEISGIFLFDGFLKIPLERIYAAKIIFQCTIIMVVLSIITAPFRAALVAHENLLYISIIDILDGIWKVVIALLIANSSLDRLIEYAILTVGIYIFSFLCFAIFDFIKYKECTFPRKQDFNKTMMKNLTSFAGWSLYSTGCIVGRNQGVAIVLNIFYGTIVNAAYGIACQISGAVNYIGSALQTAISPKIVMEEGKGCRIEMLRYSKILSKISFILMIMIGIPIIININPLLEFWLTNVPKYSSVLCIIVILAAIFDQLTIGLAIANRAIGKLKYYSLFVDTQKIFTVPLLVVLLYLKTPLTYAFWAYALMELSSALMRFPILMKSININKKLWIMDIVIRSLIPIIALIIFNVIFAYFKLNLVCFILEFIFSSIIYLILCYKYSLSDFEQSYVKNLILRIYSHIK